MCFKTWRTFSICTAQCWVKWRTWLTTDEVLLPTFLYLVSKSCVCGVCMFVSLVESSCKERLQQGILPILLKYCSFFRIYIGKRNDLILLFSTFCCWFSDNLQWMDVYCLCGLHLWTAEYVNNYERALIVLARERRGERALDVFVRIQVWTLQQEPRTCS